MFPNGICTVKKDYANARKLLEKSIDFLSSAQKKKLEYIKEHQLQ